MFIALVFLAHIYVDLIVSATNVFVVFLSTINKHFLLLKLYLLLYDLMVGSELFNDLN